MGRDLEVELLLKAEAEEAAAAAGSGPPAGCGVHAADACAIKTAEGQASVVGRGRAAAIDGSGEVGSPGGQRRRGAAPQPAESIVSPGAGLVGSVLACHRLKSTCLHAPTASHPCLPNPTTPPQHLTTAAGAPAAGGPPAGARRAAGAAAGGGARAGGPPHRRLPAPGRPVSVGLGAAAARLLSRVHGCRRCELRAAQGPCPAVRPGAGAEQPPTISRSPLSAPLN